MLHSWPCFQGPCAMYFCSYSYSYYIPYHRRRLHWAEFWIVACMWHPLYPQKKTQIQMMIAFAVHGVTFSSTRQLHVACLSHSLHRTHDFSHATDSYYCAWFARFSHDLPFVKSLPPIGYVVNLLIPPGADYYYPDVALSSVDANLTLSFCALKQNLFLIRSSNSHRRRQL